MTAGRPCLPLGPCSLHYTTLPLLHERQRGVVDRARVQVPAHLSQLCDPGPSLNLSEPGRPQVGGGAGAGTRTEACLTGLL